MGLADVATEQGGAFSRSQAIVAGYSPRRIKRRLGSGDWTVIHPRVYAARSADLGNYGLVWAAYLAGGQGAVVSHLTAARLHGIRDAPSDPWVTVPPQRHLVLHGVHLVRVPISDEDMDLLNGMLVTSRERTVVDCLCVLSFSGALDLLDRALQKRWITCETLAERTRRRLGRQGTPQLRRLLRYATHDARFEAEWRLHTLLREAGIKDWEGNAEIRDGMGRLLAVTDVLFRRLRLAIEVDGCAHHSAMDRFQRDRSRQNALVAAGYTVLRFTWYDIVERPTYVLASIGEVVQRLTPAA